MVNHSDWGKGKQSGKKPVIMPLRPTSGMKRGPLWWETGV